MAKPDSLTDLLVDDDDEGVVNKIVSFLGLRREAFKCNHCDTPCEKDVTYYRETAAFNDGKQPCWTCPNCDSQFIREPDTDRVTMDLYGRD